MEHGAVFGVVDALLQADLVAKLGQQAHGFSVHQVLGQVEMKVAGVKAQALHTLRILGEPLAQVDAILLQLVEMLLQIGPSLGLLCIHGRIDRH